jgi:peptidoglycan biosynthesis protein MviN/MurJ (putative lipid II flippase)
VLAVQLVASLAFPAITRTQPGTPERQRALGLAFVLAWALACAAVCVVATFSLPIASLLFGWGRMSASDLEMIAQWSAIGIWSLLPQALIAVVLTVMATAGRMHAAVWVLAAGLAAMLAAGLLGDMNGVRVMWLLNAVFGCMAVVLMALERRRIWASLPCAAGLMPLVVCAVLVALKPMWVGLSTPAAALCGAVYGLLVLSSAVIASPLLRGWLWGKFKPAVTAA